MDQLPIDILEFIGEKLDFHNFLNLFSITNEFRKKFINSNSIQQRVETYLSDKQQKRNEYLEKLPTKTNLITRIHNYESFRDIMIAFDEPFYLLPNRPYNLSIVSEKMLYNLISIHINRYSLFIHEGDEPKVKIDKWLSEILNRKEGEIILYNQTLFSNLTIRKTKITKEFYHSYLTILAISRYIPDLELYSDNALKQLIHDILTDITFFKKYECKYK